MLELRIYLTTENNIPEDLNLQQEPQNSHKDILHFTQKSRTINFYTVLNPLNTKFNPIYHLMALLEAHHILHVSKIRVNSNETHIYDVYVEHTHWHICHKDLKEFSEILLDLHTKLK